VVTIRTIDLKKHKKPRSTARRRLDRRAAGPCSVRKGNCSPVV